eukprot:UN23252
MHFISCFSTLSNQQIKSAVATNYMCTFSQVARFNVKEASSKKVQI